MTTGRILFCTLGYEPGAVGGAERQARLQAEELVRRGWSVDVVTARDRGTASGELGDVRIHRLPRINRRLLRTLTYLPILLFWLLRNARRYDLIHVHLANLQADIAGIACRAARRPLYIKLAAGGPRGEVARMRPVAWLTRYIGIRSAGRLQATSEEIVHDLRAIGIPESRIARIPNGLPSGVYVPPTPAERSRLRRELDLPEDRCLILYTGRFAKYKGVPTLLEAWAAATFDRPATLVMVGAPAIDDPVTVAGRENVIVRPWATSVVAYLKAADIYVHPSLADGMPNALLEAMSTGLPAVATRVAAIPEMIEDGSSGLLVEPGSAAEITGAMTRLVADPALRARLGEVAAERASSVYPIGRVVERIETAYRELVGNSA